MEKFKGHGKESCSKCGEDRPFMQKIAYVGETKRAVLDPMGMRYERTIPGVLRIECPCGHQWERLPLDHGASNA